MFDEHSTLICVFDVTVSINKNIVILAVVVVHKSSTTTTTTTTCFSLCTTILVALRDSTSTYLLNETIIVFEKRLKKLEIEKGKGDCFENMKIVNCYYLDCALVTLDFKSIIILL